MSLVSVVRLALKVSLFGTALSVLVYSNSVLMPFSLPRIIFFRALVEIAVILFFVNLALQPRRAQVGMLLRLKVLFRNPIVILLSLFFFSYAISSFFADNAYRAFWGTLERGEGVFGMLHFYIYFLLLCLVFSKKDWLRYFKFSVAIGLFLILYAFLEYFNLRFLFWEPWAKDRPESLVGNPAFFATHLIFLTVFAAIIFSLELSRRTLWSKFSTVYIPLSLIVLFLTKTRGAILGVALGIFLILLVLALSNHPRVTRPLRNLHLSLKSVAVLGLASIILFSGVFWGTRTGDFWQKLPGLDRLALSGSGDIYGNSGQFRIITWKLSWEAFKERPVFGWGPENFINAYEKYYNPDYSLFGDTWLDRAHNQIFDILVMQGIVGLLVYLGLFAAFIYVLVKKVYKENLILSLALLFGIAAYFTQNLFLFDQILSDMAFFGLLAFVTSCASGFDEESQAEPRSESDGFGMIGAAIFVTVLCAVSLYYFHIIPYAQAKLYKTSPRGVSIERSYELLKQALEPYNFAQTAIRGYGIDAVYMDNYFYNQRILTAPESSKLTDLLIRSIHEVVVREPYDVRFHIREAQMLAEVARTYDDNDPRIAEINYKIEELMISALERAPKRQDLYYHLAFSLAGQDKRKEAMDAAEYAISLSPGVPRSYINAAVIYAIAKERQKSEAALKKLETFPLPYRGFMQSDYDSLMLTYNTFGYEEKGIELARASALKVFPYTFDRQHYWNALDYYRTKQDEESFIIIARHLAEFEDLREDMEVLIDLAEKGEWNILKSL